MWARIQNNIVLEVTDTDPKGLFHPSISWLEVPEETKAGMVKSGDTYDYPAPEVEPPKTIFTAREFLRKLTVAEKVAMKTHEDIGVQLWYDELVAADFVDIEDPDTIAAASYGVQQGVFDEARKDELLTPEPIS